MDKVKIQEIAEEAGLSNGDLIEKAKELGFDVKAANSTISYDDAGILVDFAISGTLPKGFKKATKKSKITVVKKAETKVEEKVSEDKPAVVESAPKEDVAEVKEPAEEDSTSAMEKPVEEVAEEKVAPAPKEVKKRKGISVVSKKIETSENTGANSEARPAKRALSRGGIKIVRKAKPAPVRANTKISLGSKNYEPYEGKKKPKKGPAQA
ncbi:MAG TPA: translation initiation factor IF-2, partial [Epsilonproteobacteria bacterium]|nr:translation initiation factor IF-2 [Campylobacterota bacterium]